MKTRKTLLALTIAAAVSTFSLAISAEVLAPATVSAAPAAVAPSTAPAKATFKIVDQKTNAARTVYAAAPNEFVGTSAKPASSALAKPSWYAFGHP